MKSGWNPAISLGFPKFCSSMIPYAFCPRPFLLHLEDEPHGAQPREVLKRLREEEPSCKSLQTQRLKIRLTFMRIKSLFFSS